MITNAKMNIVDSPQNESNHIDGLVYYVLFNNLGRSSAHHRCTDDFATIRSHLVLFSAALVERVKSIPVHSTLLSSHLFLFLPLLFPLTVLCRSTLLDQNTLRRGKTTLVFVFDKGQAIIMFSNSCLDLSANLFIGYLVLVRNV